VVHLACHGYANWVNPAASQLILPDHETSPLTVADITAQRVTSDLAYLSACDTTVTSPELADEAVHITGAFHLAGYQHVIGTLWPIGDRAAMKLAVDFYTFLTHDGATPPDTRLVANALHHAIRNLRSQYPSSPTFWASHTHTGV
jgi:CHAT domain-containing protein